MESFKIKGSYTNTKNLILEQFFLRGVNKKGEMEIIT